MTVERAPFLPDQPVQLSEDAFNHQDYTDTLVSMVTDERPPATIGVFGRWGVGKSTIVGGIQENLAGRDFAFVYFDAWRYEGDSLRRQFLLEVAGQLENDPRGTQLDDFNSEKDLRELDVDVQELEEKFAFSWPRAKRAAIVGGVFALATFAAAMLGLFNSLLEGTAFDKRVLSGALVGAVAFLASLLSQTVVVNATTLTRRTLQDPDRFSNKFADLIGALKPKRLVVAIDNLDRCAPDKAVQMLSTIKTYLEPAAGSHEGPRSVAHKAAAEKEVVFVVAVDDEALRRHLIAQELDRSRGQDDVVAARSYVDEYLAKFFSARLPIRTVLPDDMRAYVKDHVEPLARARDLDDTTQTRLIGLISSALRTNPRRVKQFVNDLEARIRLLEEREAKKGDKAPGIYPPVSGEVLMIAKLALLESEWPEAFEILQREQRRLDEWQSRAETQREIDWGADTRDSDGEEEEGQDQASEHTTRERRRFGDFLRQSRDIETEHLRALLSLKQSRDEVELPGFTEFRAAIVAGDLDAVEGLLADVDEEGREKFAGQLRAIVDEELEQGYLDGARAAVNAAVSLEPLREPESARRDALSRAVDDVRLLDQLSLLDPITVLHTGELLPAASRGLLLQPFVDRFADDEIADDDRRTAAQGLAKYCDELTNAQRGEIGEALAGNVASKFEVYVTLAEADPELLPGGVARAAVEALAAEETPTWAGRGGAVTVARLALAQHGHEDLEQLLIDQFIQILSANESDEDSLREQIDAAEQLLPPLRSVGPEHWTRLAEHIQQGWVNYPRGVEPALVRLLGTILDKANEPAQSAVPAAVLESAFADPDHGVELATRVDNWPDFFLEPLESQLVATASTHLASREKAAEVLVDIAGDDAATQLSRVFTSLLERDSFDAALELLDEQEETLATQLGELSDAIATHTVRAIEAGGASPGALLARTARHLTDQHAAAIGDALTSHLQSGREPGQDVATRLKGVSDADPIRRAAVGPLVSSLAGVSQIDATLQPRLSAIAAHADVLDDEQLRKVGEQFTAWLRAHPDQAVFLATQLRTISGFRAAVTEDLVKALIDVEKASADHATKVELLHSADVIRGATNSRATKAFNKRMRELRDGDESERSVAEDVESRHD
jgi:hypothetical protein